MTTIPQKTMMPPPPPDFEKRYITIDQTTAKSRKNSKLKSFMGIVLLSLTGAGISYGLVKLDSSKSSKSSIIQNTKLQKSSKISPKKILTKKNAIPIKVAKPVIPTESSIPQELRVYTVNHGKFEIKNINEAKKLGYSIIDLSDDFTPYIFSETTDLKNNYRQTYINIANDIIDENGKKLSENEHNYVELYGIPPSFEVVAKRFKEDSQKKCFNSLNYKMFKHSPIIVKYVSKRNLAKEVAELLSQIKKAKRKTGKKSLASLRKIKKYTYLVKKYKLLRAKLYVAEETQRRLKCEGLLNHYTPGVINYSTIRAIKRFEHKHMIYGWGIIAGNTKKGFSRTPLENNFRTLKRVIENRVAWSLGILEDGSVNKVKGLKDTFKGKDGKIYKVPNLLKMYTNKILKEMNIETPEKAQEFFSKVDLKFFDKMKIAIILPNVPEYYSADMDFFVKIDRGDVWYEPPYDVTGKRRYHPIFRRPRLYLYVRYNNQEIPLVRWGTTIGGWRTEYKDGKEYLAYKNSDVGKRIWKDIYAAPVWIPPASTPPAALIKTKKINGRWITDVNRSEIGPSYASAYGLVAAYHIRNRTDSGKSIWFDNGIRTHGSVDYMSIMRRHSHGCHRLHNHLAVRLFSFILKHRTFERKGQSKVIYTRKLEVKNKTYKFHIDTRGYRFSLVKPIPVEVLSGRILGKLKKPFEGYFPKPGVTYEKEDPNLNDNDKNDQNIEKPTEKNQTSTMSDKLSNKNKIEKSKKITKITKTTKITKNTKLPPPPKNIKPVYNIH